jgi:hypothetical protein
MDYMVKQRGKPPQMFSTLAAAMAAAGKETAIWAYSVRHARWEVIRCNG